MPIVLIAEDKADLRDLLRLLLEREGCGVVEAANGQEALEQARFFRPNLIFMDLAMPVMDGIEACRRLRKESHTDTVPIIALTAYQDKMKEAVDAGCNECVIKPISSIVLRRVLQEYVESWP